MFADAELTYLLFCAALTRNAKLGHGREGYYLTENGEVVLYDLCKAIGTAMVEQGLGTDADTTAFTSEERVKYFGKDLFANVFFSHVRGRGDRGRRDLGWTPKHSTEEILEEVPEVVKLVAQTSKKDT